MAYIENPFYEGQKFVCISDNFPVVATTDNKSLIGTQPNFHPKKGEILTIDEILGEYLRFIKYDIHEETHPEYGFRWWKHTRFEPLLEIEESELEVKEGVI